MSSEYQNLDELIDACRGHSDDLQLPEMAALADALQTDPEIRRRWEKMQAIDESLGQSIRDVPIPLGLEARLLAALASQQPRPEMLEDDELNINQDDLTDAELVTPSSSAVIQPSRSRWKLWVAGGSLAGLLLLALVVFKSKPSLASQQDVASYTGIWLTNLTTEWSGGLNETHPLPQQPVLRSYGWQQVRGTSTSFDVVCYQIHPSRFPTRLFVCRSTGGVNLASSPPTKSLPAAGWSVGGWQENGLVYVLAVQGSDQQYQAVVNVNTNLAAVRRTWCTRLACGFVARGPRASRA